MSQIDPNATETTTEDLTEDQLFSRISQAISEGSYDDLDKLLQEPESKEVPTEAATVEEPVVEEPVVTEEASSGEVTTTASTEVQPQKGAEVTHSDWTASLPKEAQEELTRLRNVERNAKAEAGRVPWLQRKLDELEKKLHKTTAPTNESLPNQTSSGSPQHQVLPNNKELMEALSQIEEVDPVTAKVLKLIREEAQGSVKKTESILYQRDEQAQIQREYEKLVKLVPQAPDVFKLPEWRMWKEEQSPGIAALASSSYADDVYVAMEKFARDMQAKNPHLGNPTTERKDTATSTTTATASAPVVDPKQAAIVEQRTRRLAATSPSGGAPSTKVDINPKDAEALFSQAYKEIQKTDHLIKKS